MKSEEIQLENSMGTGYVLPLGGAFDVAALGRFGYPAARVRPACGDSVATLEDLVWGVIKEANVPAQKLGISNGMSGKEALDLLS